LFAILGLVLLIRYRTPIVQFISNIEKIGPGHESIDQSYGLLALGMIGFCLVAVVKILTHRQ
jgi:hypothetical protein